MGVDQRNGLPRRLGLVLGSSEIPTGGHSRAEASISLRGLLHTLPGYGVALLAVLFATLLKLLLGPMVGQTPFLLFLGAIMLGSWSSGLGPGLLSTAVAAATVDLLYFDPRFSLTISQGNDALQLMLFLLEALVIVLLTAQLHSARRRAAASAAEALAAVRIRNEFLAGAAHDLRQPLTAIRGMAQIMRSNLSRSDIAQREQHVELLSQIEESGTRMAEMLDELLDLARLQAGEQLELHTSPTDLVRLTAAKVRAFQATVQSPIRLEIPELQLVGVWDATRLGRVIDNLLSNAVKYSPNGSEILIRLHHQQNGDCGGEAVLEVQDRGLGIPASDLPHIFERYYRAGNVRKQIAGMGIGLAGARQIVQQHGGTIAVASQEGKGTTVTIRLPLDSALPATASGPR